MSDGVRAKTADSEPRSQQGPPQVPPPAAFPSSFDFRVTHRDSQTKARCGVLKTSHGTVETPVFMPVGTVGTVKGITQEQLEQLGVEIILGNTYHLYLRPGEEVIRDLGGLHRFMSWNRAILTDSGGYQVFSMSALRKLSEAGVEFRSHLDGSLHQLTPERAMEIQAALGSDIRMVLDECIEYPASEVAARNSMELTLRWAGRCKEAWQKISVEGRETGAGLLFGIVQGGTFPELRKKCAEELVAMDFPGYAIGGLSVGEARPLTYDLVGAAEPFLPEDRPRYVMGVGLPEELPHYVALGVDMMDCVLPTRNGRNGLLFTSKGRLHIRQVRYAKDERPPDEDCACGVCRRYSRAYLRHLFVAQEMLGKMLNSYHNLFFYLDTMRRIRETIAAGVFDRFLSDFTHRVQGEVP
ncbi:MAG: tRNA guanosine(34) transglycosylase Tgt [Acidobacteria bacterium]|nr:tRNA guanosine(34) transglycosylase Tgt [Acidobacteriota bacterium]